MSSSSSSGRFFYSAFFSDCLDCRWLISIFSWLLMAGVLSTFPLKYARISSLSATLMMSMPYFEQR